MPWRDVWLTIQGIYQADQGLRRAAYIIRCSLVEKPGDIQKIWPLPLDGVSDEELFLEAANIFREQFKQRNGNNAGS